jgi:multimeric flavodoxin WrbA
MTDYHVIVFAMPLFFGTVPAQMKSFMDRMYSQIKIKNGHTANPEFENKAFAFIATAGAENSNGLPLLEGYMKDIAAEFKVRLYSFVITSCNADRNVLLEKIDVKEQAKGFGEILSNI